MPLYVLVDGPLNNHVYELPEYQLGQGFEMSRIPGHEHLDGTTYVLLEDGRLHYLPPDKERNREKPG